MSLLFETICIQDGQIQHLPYHQQRLSRSRKEFLKLDTSLILKEHIIIPPFYKKGLVKCRVSYAENISDISYQHYTPRKINSIKIIHDDTVSYDYKYENRSRLKMLFHSRQGHDEILIIKNDLVTDCFYYNVAFWDGKDWLTPKSPLLSGSARARLLESNTIRESAITANQIKSFTKICLFNALNDFGEVELTIEQIF